MYVAGQYSFGKSFLHVERPRIHGASGAAPPHGPWTITSEMTRKPSGSCSNLSGSSAVTYWSTSSGERILEYSSFHERMWQCGHAVSLAFETLQCTKLQSSKRYQITISEINM